MLVPPPPQDRQGNQLDILPFTRLCCQLLLLFVCIAGDGSSGVCFSIEIFHSLLTTVETKVIPSFFVFVLFLASACCSHSFLLVSFHCWSIVKFQFSFPFSFYLSACSALFYASHARTTHRATKPFSASNSWYLLLQFAFSLDERLKLLASSLGACAESRHEDYSVKLESFGRL